MCRIRLVVLYPPVRLRPATRDNRARAAGGREVNYKPELRTFQRVTTLQTLVTVKRVNEWLKFIKRSPIARSLQIGEGRIDRSLVANRTLNRGIAGIFRRWS